VPIQLAILVSGRGSNLKAILSAIERKELDARVKVVISNQQQAQALQIARDFGVPALAVPNIGLTRSQHEQALLKELGQYAVDYVVLAGYMRVLSPEFLSTFKHKSGFYRVINVHPSLLPAFPGKNAYEDAFTYGVMVSGITIHLVDEMVDHGPILAQEVFQRLPDDTLETFKARGLAVEHKLYPKVLQQIALNQMPLLSREAVT
jgi:formyltetrahydrofolate-dependent phosphoribosylglycinamide formyltransferase